MTVTGKMDLSGLSDGSTMTGVGQLILRSSGEIVFNSYAYPPSANVLMEHMGNAFKTTEVGSKISSYYDKAPYSPSEPYSVSYTYNGTYWVMDNESATGYTYDNYLQKNIFDSYDTLKRAFDNAAENSTITLTRDVTVQSIPENNHLSIDLNGKTLKVTEKVIFKTESAEKMYDGTALTAEYVVPSIVKGSVTVDIVMNKGITDVGKKENSIESYKIFVGTTDVTACYENKEFQYGELTVTKAPLIASYVSELIKCGETPKYEVEYSGFVAGQDKNVLKAVPTVIGPSSLSAGVYVLEPSNGSSDNYDISYAPGVLTVVHDMTKVEKSGDIIEHYMCKGCSNHYIDSAGDVQYTLPKDGSKHQVSSEVSVEEGKAVVDESTVKEQKDAIDKIKAADPSAVVAAEIKIDDTNVKSVSIDSKDAKDLAEKASDIILSAPALSASFTSGTMKEIATGGIFELNAKKTTDYPEKYKDMVGDSGIVIDISLKVGGNAVTQFNEKVKLSFYYEIPAGHSAKELRIWCISGDSPEEFDCTYDENTKMVTAETMHFSQYAVVLDSSSGDGGSNDNTALYVICAVIAVLVIILVLFFVLKKRK